MKSLDALRALARYQTHGGYTWAMVADDSELLCVLCVRENYRQIYRATKKRDKSGWQCIGITHSGESETLESCAHCGKTLWDSGD